MNKIKVAILNHSFNGMPIFLARLTQRGHQINSMQDLLKLYSDCVDKEPSKELLSLPHTTIQRMCTMTVAIFGLSTKAVSQLRTHAKRATFVSTSTQYSDYSNVEDAFVIPEHVNDEMKSYSFSAQCEAIQKIYSTLISSGVDKDDASYLLPQGLRKCLIVHANFADWKYILSTRLCNRNTREVQYICELILQAMRLQIGDVWAGLCLPSCCYDGCKEGKFCCGHKYEDTSKEAIKKQIITPLEDLILTTNKNEIRS